MAESAPRRIVGYEYLEWSHGGKGVPWRVNTPEFNQLRLDGWDIVAIYDTFTLLDRPLWETVPMPEMPETIRENEIFFADFPHELVGMTQMDKYTLRDWLVGYAIRHGWTCSRLERLSLDLTKDGVNVLVEIGPDGLVMTSGERSYLLETCR